MRECMSSTCYSAWPRTLWDEYSYYPLYKERNRSSEETNNFALGATKCYCPFMNRKPSLLAHDHNLWPLKGNSLNLIFSDLHANTHKQQEMIHRVPLLLCFSTRSYCKNCVQASWLTGRDIRKRREYGAFQDTGLSSRIRAH